MRKTLGIAAALAFLTNCGENPSGSGGSAPECRWPGPSAFLSDSNAVALYVDQGPQGLGNRYANGLFASVTLCEPGTANCQTIDHMLVDTGSVGVRVLESELALTLPQVTDASGLVVAECSRFVYGAAWGPLRLADVQLGGETAENLPVQTIGTRTYPLASDCAGTPITDLQTLAANGILGVGVSVQDCGQACAAPTGSLLNPGRYYTCSTTLSGGCKIASVPVVQQVSNPVALFPNDNNGTIIELPCVPEGGASAVSGTLVFGIGTQANNGLGNTTVLSLDSSGFLLTAFPAGGSQYSSYLDSGSNAFYFLDAATSGLRPCAGSAEGYYCANPTVNLDATIIGANGTSANIAFSVGDGSRLAASAVAFSDLAGPVPGFSTHADTVDFIWGLPFFFGRNVFAAIENTSKPGGAGPYFAF